MNANARPIEGPVAHQLEWHAKRRWHRGVLAEAEASIHGALDLCERPYVAFSCGKDSTALALLVHEQDPGVPLRFLSSAETREMHDVDGVLDWFRRRGATVGEWSVDEVGESWDEHQMVSRDQRYAALYHGGRDLVFMGLRSAESPARARSLATHTSPDLPRHCYRYRSGDRSGVVRCCPLARWTDDDVVAVIARHGAPLLAAYHTFGVGARTTARLTQRTVHAGSLAQLKRTNAAGLGAILRRFPELRSAL